MKPNHKLLDLLALTPGQQRHQDSTHSVSKIFLFLPLLLLGIMLTLIAGSDVELAAQVVPTVFLIIIAFVLAAFNSRWLVIYIICVYVFTPELRRVVDWEYHHYHSITALSLAPILCNAALLLPIMRRPYGLTRQLKTALILMGLSVAYAAVLGLARNGAIALYEAAILVLPLILVPYLALRPLDVRERDQWLSAFVTIGVVVAGYGWFQFVTAPPWDMFWLTESGMTSSMGQPEAFGFRVFSTINSTGPAAWFLSFTIAVAFVNRRWRGPFGWFGILLMVSALAITEVRSGWIAAFVLVAAYAALSSGPARWRLLAGILLLGIGLSVALPSLPGGEKTLARVQTFSNLKEDNSASARTNLTVGLVPVLLSNPFGKGTGSTGVGDKLNQKGNDSAGNGSFDNGLFALILTFGFIGSVGFFYGAWLIGCAVFGSGTNSELGPHSRLGQTVCLTTLILLCFNNAIEGMGGLIVWFLICSALGQSSPQPAEIKNKEALHTAQRGAGA